MIEPECGFRSHYVEALGIDPQGDDPRRKSALSRAHEIRKFEIELYWKRATYFWAFQVAAFAAVGFFVKDGNIQYPELVVPCAVGAVTAWAGYLTARGSKFWQENWESHVDLLELGEEGRLTEVVLASGMTQFSVSRINQRLMLMLTVAWLITVFWSELPELRRLYAAVPSIVQHTAILSALGLIMGSLFLTRSKFSGRVYRDGLSGWSESMTENRGHGARIIWRDPLGGRERSRRKH